MFADYKKMTKLIKKAKKVYVNVKLGAETYAHLRIYKRQLLVFFEGINHYSACKELFSYRVVEDSLYINEDVKL